MERERERTLSEGRWHRFGIEKAALWRGCGVRGGAVGAWKEELGAAVGVSPAAVARNMWEGLCQGV
jgi:hypothetical protein